MRLLIKLQSLDSYYYDREYYTKIQGLIFNLLRNSEYSLLHDKGGYKFFCFSNIFPFSEFINEGDERTLIISSPDRYLIEVIKNKLIEKEFISIGRCEFKITNINKLDIKLQHNCRLIASTPIIVRIPEWNYEKYNIPKEYRKPRYVYWRPEYSFEAFVKQLEENLIKKYKEFFKKEIYIDRIFEIFRFIKGPIAVPVDIKGKKQVFVGSLWEFSFSVLSKAQMEILKFGIDCGFGERNSLGFGFINVI